MGPSAHRVAIAIALASTMAVSVARAEPTGEQRALATALFQEGKALLAAGEAAAACPKLEESQRLDPGIGTLLNVASCHVAIGRTATAWAELHEALALAERADQRDRVRFAEERIAELAPRLSHLEVVVAAPHDGLELTLDAAPLARPAWGISIPVDPGTHRVRAAAPGRVTWETTVVVAEPTRSARVEVPPLALAPAPPAPPPPAPPPAVEPARPPPPAAPAPPPPAPALSPSVVVGWTSAALGVVGLAIGTGAAAVAFDRDSESDDLCNPDCDERGYALNQEAGTAADVSTASFLVGGALLTLGVALLVEGALRGPEAAAATVARRGRVAVGGF